MTSETIEQRQAEIADQNDRMLCFFAALCIGAASGATALLAWLLF